MSVLLSEINTSVSNSRFRSAKQIFTFVGLELAALPRGPREGVLAAAAVLEAQRGRLPPKVISSAQIKQLLHFRGEIVSFRSI